MMAELMKQGAESRIYMSTFNGQACVVKERFQKTYRVPELDLEIRKKGFKREKKAIEKCLANNIPVPKLLHADSESFKLYLEYVDNSQSLCDYMKNNPSTDEVERVLQAVASVVARVHHVGIVHGDITTSNILLAGDKLAPIIIDFGLCRSSVSDEDRAVDLYVFERSLEASLTPQEGKDDHSESDDMIDNPILFQKFLHAYENSLVALECLSSNSKSHKIKQSQVLKRLSQVQLRGRKRDMIG